MRKFIRQLLILLVLVSIFVLPVSAKQIKGKDGVTASGTTTVTAHVAGSSEDVEPDDIKTGDNSQCKYICFCL